ncbi:MAG: hypothetical protein RSD14_00225 [Clostridia bacterium]
MKLKPNFKNINFLNKIEKNQNINENINENKRYIISFPQLGNYCIPIYNLLAKIIDDKTTTILMPNKTTNKTIDIGTQVSPDFICVPFKYNMGNFIESLEKGANVLIQAGGGCRYGYYAEVQEQILRDLGYKFTYISLLDASGVDIFKLYKKFKLLNLKLKFKDFAKYFLLTIKMIYILDEFEKYIRDNIVFEENKGEFEALHKKFLDELLIVKNIGHLRAIKKKYDTLAKKVKLIARNGENSLIKVGVVGELYTSMEPFATFFLERQLANLGIKSKRYTTVTYLLFEKAKAEKGLLKTAKNYIEYAIGADGTESIAHTLELIDKGYDGIIHIKPFGCTPEINAMPILQKISSDKNIPIIYMTFDSQTSEVGIKTRLEAFYDMLKMKKENGVRF